MFLERRELLQTITRSQNEGIAVTHRKAFGDVEGNLERSGADTRCRDVLARRTTSSRSPMRIVDRKQRQVKPIRPDRFAAKPVRAADRFSQLRDRRYDFSLRKQCKEQIDRDVSLAPRVPVSFLTIICR